jgi:hypothetical protein
MIKAIETEDRRRQLGRARDFQSSHQATTKDHWGRWRDVEARETEVRRRQLGRAKEF